MSVSEKTELFTYLGDREVRHLYVDSTIRQFLALKIKALREARELDQYTLGQLAGGMKQSSISRLEHPSYAKMTLKTLKRLAEAFDVALLVDFVPFSELVTRTIDRTEADFAPPSYEEERTHALFVLDVKPKTTGATVDPLWPAPMPASQASGSGYDLEDNVFDKLEQERSAKTA